jgi:glutaredoxin
MAATRSTSGGFDKTLAIAVGVLVIFTLLMVCTGCRIPKAFEMYSDGGASGSRPVLQYFRMDGCPHCVKFDSVWSEVKAEGADLAEFEVHAAGGTEAEKHGVRSFPHIQKVVAGQVTEFEGKRDKQTILRFVSS